jgi:Na+/melibiose symporter-like transporter
MACARRFEKKSILIAAMVAIALGMLPGLFLQPGQLVAAVAFATLAGFASGGTDTLFPSVQADVIDVDEERTGERKEGTYFAVWSFASKTAASGVGVLVGFALATAGYVPNAEQSPSTLATIRALYAGVPLVFWTAGILVFRRFHLDAAEHKRIRASIDARDAAV